MPRRFTQVRRRRWCRHLRPTLRLLRRNSRHTSPTISAGHTHDAVDRDDDPDQFRSAHQLPVNLRSVRDHHRVDHAQHHAVGHDPQRRIERHRHPPPASGPQTPAASPPECTQRSPRPPPSGSAPPSTCIDQSRDRLDQVQRVDRAPRSPRSRVAFRSPYAATVFTRFETPPVSALLQPSTRPRKKPLIAIEHRRPRQRRVLVRPLTRR